MNWNSDIRKGVFWPPLVLLLVALIMSLVANEPFVEAMKASNDFILNQFGTAFVVVSLMLIVLCLVVFISPLGRVKIGGAEAAPILSRWRWFAIILCTTIATGILFWGTAEPLFHLKASRAQFGFSSQEAELFAMSSLFLHWSFSPYAIYSIPAMMFALAYYNKGYTFSIQAMLFPFQKLAVIGKIRSVIDAACLFALVAGMSASLGAGILTLSGGLGSILGVKVDFWGQLIVTLLIVATFCVSSVSGLMKGIRVLSSINIWIFAFIALFILFAGPLEFITSSLFKWLGEYIGTFGSKNLLLFTEHDEWAKSWTVFNWANWMAWAPVTALFLGKIAKGYTVREFLLFNWVIPSVFAIIWMSILGGSAVFYQQNGTLDLLGALDRLGPESIIYQILEHLPLSDIVIAVFLFAVFLSYVTAADSNTDAIADLSTVGLSPAMIVKIIWGLLIGVVALVMINAAGIDGVKMLSNLGGLPVMVLLVVTSFAVVKLLFQSEVLDD